MLLDRNHFSKYIQYIFQKTCPLIEQQTYAIRKKRISIDKYTFFPTYSVNDDVPTYNIKNIKTTTYTFKLLLESAHFHAGCNLSQQ